MSEPEPLVSLELPLRPTYDAAALLSQSATPRAWLVQDLIPAGYILLWFSPEAMGKTVLAHDLSIAVSTGQPFLNLPSLKGKVLYVDEENPDTYTIEVLNKLCIGRNVSHESLRDTMLISKNAIGNKDTRKWANELKQTIGLINPSLVVIDTLSCLLPASEGIENDTAIMKSILRSLRWAKGENSSITFLVLHHPSKSRRNVPRGAGAIGQDVDGYWVLKYPPGRPPKTLDDRPTLLEPRKARCLSGIRTYRVTPDKSIGYRLIGSVEE